MEDLRRELNGAYERAARYRRAGNLLRKLWVDEEALVQRVQTLETQMGKESADVDKLETGSVSAALYKLLGKYDQQLEKERTEWLTAKLKYDEAKQALVEVRRQIAEMEEERAALTGSEEAYAALYAQKTELLLRRGGEAARRITALVENIGQTEASQREIGEAIKAGQNAVSRLQAALGYLDDAESWGEFDMFGGGMIVSAIKQGHIDDAADAASTAQHALDRFNAELADIQVTPLGDVSMGEGLRFADLFFDGLIVDWMAQRGIEQSRNSVEATRSDVVLALNRLKSMANEEEARQHALEDELGKLVLEA